jgi:hypothetical protein
MTSNFKTCDIMRKKGIMYSLLLWPCLHHSNLQ